ncbi:hypothetical protein M885DRAFT_567903 [Pelagophyceae sp. CCMP2097]|nr:hypothetical protein M885DRAFT_567903 [Pelagophyceae sp. CCMP2097]
MAAPFMMAPLIAHRFSRRFQRETAPRAEAPAARAAASSPALSAAAAAPSLRATKSAPDLSAPDLCEMLAPRLSPRPAPRLSPRPVPLNERRAAPLAERPRLASPVSPQPPTPVKAAAAIRANECRLAANAREAEADARDAAFEHARRQRRDNEAAASARDMRTAEDFWIRQLTNIEAGPIRAAQRAQQHNACLRCLRRGRGCGCAARPNRPVI